MRRSTPSRGDPFGSRPPTEPFDYGSVPSNPDVTVPPPPPTIFDGLGGRFRMAFGAMETPGLPDVTYVGRVEITQQVGPIWTQQTFIKQRPGWRIRYDKTMYEGQLEVGDGLFLLLAELPITVPTQENLRDSLQRWRDEVLAAVGILAALFDERLAQRKFLEDLIVYEPDGKAMVAVDMVTRVRQFVPMKRVIAGHREFLAALGALDLSQERPEYSAARWYLKACQQGPTPDAIVYLWIAMEALAPPARGRNRSHVHRVEEGLREAGTRIDQLDMSIGRLADLRAKIVHTGVEQPPTLHESYYRLEWHVRVLIRHRLHLQGGWPTRPDLSTLLPMFRALERHLMSKPATTNIRHASKSQ